LLNERLEIRETGSSNDEQSLPEKTVPGSLFAGQLTPSPLLLSLAARNARKIKNPPAALLQHKGVTMPMLPGNKITPERESPHPPSPATNPAREVAQVYEDLLEIRLQPVLFPFLPCPARSSSRKGERRRAIIERNRYPRLRFTRA
jgi:hypothetical protein